MTELDRVLGGRTANLDDLPQLRYTEMVFAESMRIYPPAWAMGRQSTAPVALGPYRFPAGTYFFFSQYVMQRDPEYFPDPLRFDPERFTPEAKAARPRFAYFPFGGGGRQCIGESFAWMEGVLILATIAQQVAAAPAARSADRCAAQDHAAAEVSDPHAGGSAIAEPASMLCRSVTSKMEPDRTTDTGAAWISWSELSRS